MTPTEWKAVTKPRPCDECSGAGRTRDFDHDYGCEVSVRCECCCGLGELGVCTACLDGCPIPELEMWSGICRLCAADRELRAVEDEHANLRRTA